MTLRPANRPACACRPGGAQSPWGPDVRGPGFPRRIRFSRKETAPFPFHPGTTIRGLGWAGLATPLRIAVACARGEGFPLTPVWKKQAVPTPQNRAFKVATTEWGHGPGFHRRRHRDPFSPTPFRTQEGTEVRPHRHPPGSWRVQGTGGRWPNGQVRQPMG